ncbi:ATP-grasp domain-containing protein [Peptoniphilus sp. KCTC 25270]|uniref:D-alanine--D-alanine ligase family protein n=1 Tax=Peptoniphilus sp. KCTC 25270 TaxID=2897414 RepID=UPI001E287853|nr:ATP-grasp domain-containing protein [Peptoniphilus sp. KCTC 25270]MCD1146736.1 ATP-grasp domain-containing protein [Peptoniphilus sp. KCTC 25270]
MRIGIVTDVSQFRRKWLEEAMAEEMYQTNTVKEMKKVLSESFDVFHYVFDKDLVKKLKEDQIDLVFNLANGYKNHQDRGELPALLDREKIPYTGSNALGHGIADDKELASRVLEKNNIATPKTFAIQSVFDISRYQFDFPVLVKPNNEGSGRGITNKSIVYNKEDLQSLLQEMLDSYQPPVLVTEYIDGKEITVGALGNGEDVEILPILEIDFSELPDGVEKIYSFEVKHDFEENTHYYLPGRFSPEETQCIQSTAKKVFLSLGLRDYCRIDMRFKDGIPYVLEINSLAGINHESSDIVKMSEHIGMDYSELLNRIVKLAIDRYHLKDEGKEGNRDLQKLAQERMVENIQAREQDIEEHKKAGTLPQKYSESSEMYKSDETKMRLSSLHGHLESLVSAVIEVQEEILSLQEFVREIEENSIDKNKKDE